VPEPTVGKVVEYLESKRGDPVSVGGLQMRWGATIQIDDAGGWSVVDEADWWKTMRGE